MPTEKLAKGIRDWRQISVVPNVIHDASIFGGGQPSVVASKVSFSNIVPEKGVNGPFKVPENPLKQRLSLRSTVEESNRQKKRHVHSPYTLSTIFKEIEKVPEKRNFPPEYKDKINALLDAYKSRLLEMKKMAASSAEFAEHINDSSFTLRQLIVASEDLVRWRNIYGQNYSQVFEYVVPKPLVAGGRKEVSPADRHKFHPPSLIEMRKGSTIPGIIWKYKDTQKDIKSGISPYLAEKQASVVRISVKGAHCIHSGKCATCYVRDTGDKEMGEKTTYADGTPATLDDVVRFIQLEKKFPDNMEFLLTGGDMSALSATTVVKFINAIVNGVRKKEPNNPDKPVTIRIATRALATNPGIFSYEYMATLFKAIKELRHVQIIFATHVVSPSEIVKIDPNTGEYSKIGGKFVLRDDLKQVLLDIEAANTQLEIKKCGSKIKVFNQFEFSSLTNFLDMETLLVACNDAGMKTKYIFNTRPTQNYLAYQKVEPWQADKLKEEFGDNCIDSSLMLTLPLKWRIVQKAQEKIDLKDRAPFVESTEYGKLRLLHVSEHRLYWQVVRAPGVGSEDLGKIIVTKNIKGAVCFKDYVEGPYIGKQQITGCHIEYSGKVTGLAGLADNNSKYAALDTFKKLPEEKLLSSIKEFDSKHISHGISRA